MRQLISVTMVATLLILIQLLWNCQGESVGDGCPTEYRLARNYTSTPYKNGNDYVYGFSGALEVCINGTYYGVCSSSDYDQLNIAQFVCTYLEYDQNSTTTSTISNSDQFGNPAVSSISCPEGFTSLSQCNVTLADPTDGSCDTNHYSDLRVECSKRVTACSGSLYQHADQTTFTFANGSQVSTARLEVCLSGDYVPVCASVLNNQDLDMACYSWLGSDYVPGEFIGSISDYQSVDAPVVVRALSCPDDAKIIEDCEFNVTYNGCPEYEEVLTCIEHPDVSPECTGSTIRVGNGSVSTLPYDSVRTYTGRVEICRDGQYVDVCANSDFPESFVSVACSYFSADYMSAVIPYNASYGSASSGLSLTASNCTSVNEFNYIDNCGNVTVTEGGCGANNILSVFCQRDCQISGRVRLQQSVTTNYENGTTGLSGILQFCDPSDWKTVCDNNYTDFEASLFCAEFGYPNGTFLSSNPGGRLNDSSFGYVNLSCPDSSDSSTSCTIDQNAGDGVCTDQTTLYCYNAANLDNNCNEGDLQMGDMLINGGEYTIGNYWNNTQFYSGYFKLCINGSFHTLCEQDLSLDTLSLLCRNAFGAELGYFGTAFGTVNDYPLPVNSLGFYNISCQYDYFSSSSCWYDTVTDNSNGCDANGGPALVTCVDVGVIISPSCSGTRLANRGSGRFANGTYFSIGQPEVCINNTYYHPVCTNFTQEEAVVFCYDTVYDYGALTYPIYGSPNDYPTNKEAMTIISDVYCPSDRFYDFDFDNCNQTLSSSNDGCSSFQPAITCHDALKPCEEFSVVTRSVTYSYINGYFTIFYVIDFCQSNLLGRVCKAGVTDTEARLFCLTRGRSNGFVAGNYSNYTHSISPNANYTNVTCSDDSLTQCSYSITDSCSQYGGELVVGCNNDMSTPTPVPTTPPPVPTTPPPDAMGNECNITGLARLSGAFGTNQLTIGDLEICVNGYFRRVCVNDSFSDVDTDSLANPACTALGYPSSSFHSIDPSDSSFAMLDPTIINSIDCPNSFTDLLSCTFETTQSGECSTHRYDASIGCYNITTPPPSSDCLYNGQARISNQITLVNSDYESISGEVEICVDGEYYPVCGIADIPNSDSLAQLVCESMGYTDSSIFLSYSGSSPIIDSIVCDSPLFYLSQCNYSTVFNSSCTDPNSVTGIRITCSKDLNCTEGSVRLGAQNPTPNIGFGPGISGFLEICLNGEYASVCADNSSALIDLDEVARLACSDLGYPPTGSQSFLAGTLRVFVSNEIINDIYCPNDATSISSCSMMPAGPGSECTQRSSDVLLQCYNSSTPVFPECFEGQVRLANSQVTSSNVSETITGRLEICSEDGVYRELCASDYVDFDTDTIVQYACRDIGYQADGSSYIELPSFANVLVDSITCPDFFFSFFQCNISTTDDGPCFNSTPPQSIYVSCTRDLDCVEGDVRLFGQYNIDDFGLGPGVGGVIEICVNGSYLPVCVNETFASVDEDTLASITCNQLGYLGQGASFITASGSPLTSSSVIDEVYCPIMAPDFSSCSLSTTSIGECSSHEYDASVQCYNFVAPECFIDGQVRLRANSTQSLPNYETITGILEICVDGTYREVCGSTAAPEVNVTSVIQQACLDIGYTRAMSSLQYPSSSDIIDSVTCPVDLFHLSQCNFTTTDNGTCVDIREFNRIEITCTRDIITPVTTTSSNLIQPSSASISVSLASVSTSFQTSASVSTPILSPSPVVGNECSVTGEVRLSGAFGTNQLTIGDLEICVNGYFRRVCVNDSFSDVDADSLANPACTALGYPSSSFHSIDPSDSSFAMLDPTIINSIDCPDPFTDLLSCTFGTTQSGECSTHRYDASIGCYNITTPPPSSDCLYNGQARIINDVTDFNSNYESISGEVEICVDGEYYPVCGNEDIPNSDSLAQLVCESMGYTDSSSFQDYNGSSPIIDYIVCDSPLIYLTQCNYSTVNNSSSCTDPNSITGIRINCSKEISCTEGSVRLGAQNPTPDIGFGPGISGFLEICLNGEYASVCADNSSAVIDLDEVARLACSDLGYPPTESQSFLAGTLRVFVSNEIINDIYCPDDATSISSCSMMPAGPGSECTQRSSDALLQCYNSSTPVFPECFEGQVRLANSQVTSSNVSETITGRLEICSEDVVYRELCASDYVDFDTDTIVQYACRDIGYQADGSSYIELPSFANVLVDSITCPDFFFSFFQCNISTTDDGPCFNSTPPQSIYVSCTKDLGCVEGDVRLFGQYNIDDFGLGPGVGGVIEICVNGSYLPVCVNETFASVDEDTLASITCNQLGYPEQGASFITASGSPLTSSSVIDEVYCPMMASDFSSCSLSTTSIGECSSHEYDASVQCYNFVAPECFIDGQVRLRANSTQSLPNSETITGILEICVDGTYREVCGSTAAPEVNVTSVIQQACLDIGYTRAMSSLQYPSSSDIIDSVTCPVDLFHLSQCNFTTTDNGTCVDIREFNRIEITCTRDIITPVTTTSSASIQSSFLEPSATSPVVSVSFSSVSTSFQTSASVSTPVPSPSPVVGNECSVTGEARLSGAFGTNQLTIGDLEICVNGYFRRVCVNDSFSDVDADSLANPACTALGYPSSSFHSIDPSDSSFAMLDPTIINSIDCPDPFTDLLSCTFETTQSGECSTHRYDASIGCYNITVPPAASCSYNGQARLSNQVTDINSNYESISGEVEICVDGEYYPVCGNEDIPNADSLAQLVCESMGYTDSSSFQDYNGSSPIIDYIVCDSPLIYLTQCNYSTVNNSSSCTDPNSITGIRINCSKEISCTEGSVRLGAQNPTPDIGFGPGISGFLEICLNGEYASVCADNSSAVIDLDEVARLACSDLGYPPTESQSFLAGTLRVFVSNEIINDIYCPDDATSISSCSMMPAGPGSECTQRSSDVLLQCYNSSTPVFPECFEGQVRLANSQVTSSNVSETITGRLEICSEDGVYRELCASDYVDFDTDTIVQYACRDIGYQADGSSYIELPSFANVLVDSITCPDFFFSFFQCNISTTDDGPCFNSTPPQSIYVSCTRDLGCVEGDVRLFGQYNIDNFGLGPGVGGVIEICVNGSYLPVCVNETFTSVDEDTLASITCNQLGYPEQGASFITASGSLLTSSSVIDQLYCPMMASDFSSCSLSTTSIGECSSHEYDASVQCYNFVAPECFIDGQVRLRANSTQSLPNSETITGILEICVDGTYREVCGSTAAPEVNVTSVIQQACLDIGYTSSMSMLKNLSSSDIIDSVTCPVDLFHLSQCNFTTTDNGTCVDITEFNRIEITCTRDVITPVTTTVSNLIQPSSASASIQSSFLEPSATSPVVSVSFPSVSASFQTSASVSTPVPSPSPVVGNECSVTGEVRLSGAFGTNQLTIGDLEICVNGYFRRVCVNDSFSDVDADSLANPACTALGYPSSSFHSIDPSDSSFAMLDPTIINNIDCPDPFTDLLSCTFGTTQSGECSTHRYDASIGCYNITTPPPSSDCLYNGQARISNQVTLVNSDYESISGEVEICVDGEYYPVCGIADIPNSDSLAQLVCESMGYTDSSSFQDFNGSSPIIDYIVCDSPLIYLTQCNYSTVNNSNSCTDPNSITGIRINCSKEISCTEGSVRLGAQNPTPDIGFGPGISGFLEICLNGEYASVCADNSSAIIDLDEVARLACSDLGYPPTETLSFLRGVPRLFVSNEIINNTYCPDDATSISTCSPTPASSGTCTERFSDGFLLCYNVSTAVPPPVFGCIDGEFRFHNNITTSPYKDGNVYRTQFTGLLEICLNGEYRGVCSGDFDEQAIAEAVCFLQGYTGNTTVSTQTNDAQRFSDGIKYISCPDGFVSPLQCTFTLSNSSDGTCFTHHSDLHIQCTDTSPACTGELFELSDRGSFTFSNNTNVNTGRLDVCLDGYYAPVCASVLSYDQLADICNSKYTDSVPYLGQYVGSISDYQSVNAPIVVHALSCPDDAAVIDECEFNFTNNGCPEYEEVLSCIRYPPVDRCSQSHVRVGNASEVNVPFGSMQNYTGRVEVCHNGEYIDVCNGTVEAEYFAMQACENSQSSYSEAVIVPYDSVYSTALSGGSYTAVNCSNIDNNGIRSCTNVTSLYSSCPEAPLVVQCQQECSSFGRIRLQHTVTTNYENGTTGVSGVLQFCNYNSWKTVCDNNYTDYDLSRFCGILGYSNWSLLVSNPGGDIDDDGEFVNLTCPDYYQYYSPASCSVESGDESQCSDPLNLYCYNAVTQKCQQEGEFRFQDDYLRGNGMFPNETIFRIGYFQMCVNGSYHLVCNDDLTVETATYLCSRGAGFSLGYPGALYGSESGYLVPSVSKGVYNISCSEDASPSECMSSIVANYSDGCDANGGAALITCVEVPHDDSDSSCYGTRLIDTGYGRFSNGSGFTIGRPELCVNAINDHAPICGSLTHDEAVLLCNSFEGRYGALISPAVGTSYDFAMNTKATTVITDMYCPADRFYDFEISNCNVTTTNSSDGCLSHDSHAILTCYNAPTPCQDNLSSLNYVEEYSDSDGSGSYNIVRFCSSSQYNRVCRSGANDEAARLFCQANSFQDGYIDNTRFTNYTSRDSTSYGGALTNFTCSSSLEDCTFDTVKNCSQYGGDVVIVCYTPRFVCNDGEFTLLESFTGYPSDYLSPVITGYPALCVNNAYVPFCYDADTAGIYEARAACVLATEYPFGFIGSTDEYTPSPLEYNDTLSIFNVSCDYNASCIYEISEGICEDYSTVTCGRVCYDDQKRFYNQRTYLTDDGLFRISGVPQVCSDGGWVSVCNDGTNDPDLPMAICQQDFGYRYGRLIPMDEAQMYNPNPRGTLYINNITCPDVIEDYTEDCNDTLTVCPNDNQHYVVECFQYEVCQDGDIRLADSRSLTISNTDMEYTSGYPVICVDDELVPLCNSAELGLLELTSICSTAVNLTYGFPGLADNITLPPFSDINATRIATYLLCDLENPCYANTTATMDGCANNEGYATVTCARVCEDDDRRIYNNQTYHTENGLERLVGIPQTCSDGGWVSICNDGTNSDDLPDLVCQDAGYRGGYLISPNRTLYGISGPGTFYINNLTCYNNSIDDCDYNVTFTDECLLGDYDYVVECYNYQVCAPGDIRLSDTVDYTSDEGFYYTSGYPELCVNDAYIPLCNSAMPGPLELLSICSVSENLTYGFRDTPDFLSVQPYSNSGSSYVVTSLSCISDCVNETSSTCPMNGSYSVITCAHVCEDGENRLYNERNYTTPDGLLRVIGIPQTCIGGGWEPICNDGSNDDNLPDLICQDAGYRGGYLLSPNRTLYGASRPGSFYLSNLTCIGSVDNCNHSYSFTDECLSGDYDYVVECYNYQVCAPGDIRLSDTVNYTSDEGFYYTSGYPELCVNDEYIPLCDSAIPGPRELFSICSVSENLTYGFRDTPDFLSVQPYSNSGSSYVVTSLSCISDCVNETSSTCPMNGSYSVITCAHVCEDGENRLYNERNYTTADGLLRVIGIPQTCANRGWEPICNDGSNDDNLPDLICQKAGYKGGYLLSPNRTLYGASRPGSFYRSNVTCIGSVDNCSHSDSFTDECLSGDYDYVVECYNYQGCAPGDIRLSNTVDYTSDEGFYYTSGYPELCVDDEYIPLCNTSSILGLLELSAICKATVNLTYGFPGTPSFLSLAPYDSNSNTSYTVTSFDCSLTECTNQTSHNSNCVQNYAAVTCADSCSHGSYRLYNNMTTFTSDGLLRATGIPQRCENGGWTSYCTIGTIDSNLPDLLCMEWNYQNGEAIDFDDSVHQSSPLGSFYNTNLTCPSNTLPSCTSTRTYNDQCLSGSLEYLVRCYNIRTSPVITQSPESLTLLQSANANFTCQFTGDPAPQVQWTYIPPSPLPSMTLSTNDPYTISTDTSDSGTVTSTLTVSGVMVTNAGAYMCQGSNGAPNQPSEQATLTVIAVPSISITGSQNPASITEGDSFSFTCTVSDSFPTVTIVWTHESTGTVLQTNRITITTPTPTQDSISLLYTTTSVLSISNAVTSDNGGYVCRTSIIPIHNQAVVSSSLSLTVQVRNECVIEAPANQESPCVNGYCIDGANTYFCQCFDGFTGTNCDQAVTTPTAPQIIATPQTESVLLSDSASFNCTAIGEPQPTITWFKDGDTLPGESAPILVILSVGTSDRGLYSCSASNSEGTITSNEALLRIENVAQFVSDINVTTSGSRRKRQSLAQLVEDARSLVVGTEVAPNAVVVALDLVTANGGFQALFTVQTPITEDGRPNTTGVTNGLNTVTASVSQSYPQLSFTPVLRFDGCLPESTTLFGSVTLDWPEITAGENATLPCPCGAITNSIDLTASRMCYGDFMSLSEWLLPHTTQCQFDANSKELCIAAESTDALQGATILSNISSNTNSFTDEDVAIAAALFEFLADTEDLSVEVGVELLEVFNKFDNINESKLQDNSNSAERMLDGITSITSNIDLGDDGEVTLASPEVVINAREVNPENFTSLEFSITTNPDGTLGDNALSNNGSAPPTASVELPDNFLTGVPDADRIGFSVMTESVFFVQSDTLESKSTPLSVIVSLDVFAADDKLKISGLDPGLVLSFRAQSIASAEQAQCTSWNTESSRWSPDGCSKTANDSTLVTCTCTHLTSFTIVDVPPPETTPQPSVTPTLQPSATPTQFTEEVESDDEYTAQAIIIVGAVVSILLILVAVLTHLCSKNQRYSSEGKIIICSHICLIVLYITLIFATIASYTDSSGFCGTFSGLFHYTSLVYVMWIFTEGLFYVVKLRHGIEGNSLTRYLFRVMCIANFAFPVVVVAISVAAGNDYYAMENAFCRPQSYPFYFGYIIPIALIFVSSLVCLAVGILTSIMIKTKESESSFIRQFLGPHFIAAIILSLVALVVWVFGYIGTDYNISGTVSTATQYLFGFLMIIHAILLLLLTFLRSNDTREVWTNLCNYVTGRRGKYSFAEYTFDGKPVSKKDSQIIGMGASGEYGQAESTKRSNSPGDDDNLLPHKASPTAEEHADTSFSSKADKTWVDEEERIKKKEKEIESIIISNDGVAEEA